MPMLYYCCLDSPPRYFMKKDYVFIKIALTITNIDDIMYLKIKRENNRERVIHNDTRRISNLAGTA